MHKPCTSHAQAMHKPSTSHAQAVHRPCTSRAQAMHSNANFMHNDAQLCKNYSSAMQNQCASH
eukprot:2402712-Lingulodinium_polyedra.AAC.1